MCSEYKFLENGNDEMNYCIDVGSSVFVRSAADIHDGAQILTPGQDRSSFTSAIYCITDLVHPTATGLQVKRNVVENASTSI